jgi:hypothetical protein
LAGLVAKVSFSDFSDFWATLVVVFCVEAGSLFAVVVVVVVVTFEVDELVVTAKAFVSKEKGVQCSVLILSSLMGLLTVTMVPSAFLTLTILYRTFVAAAGAPFFGFGTASGDFSRAGGDSALLTGFESAGGVSDCVMVGNPRN